jgi:hypothetical protein
MNGNGRGAYSRRGRKKNRSERQNKSGRGEVDERVSPRDSGTPQHGNKNRNAGERQKNSSGFNELNRPSQTPKRGQPAGRDRPKWTAPVLPKEPIPKPLCPICGKPIEELASAINDRLSGEAAHFDCVRRKIAATELLGKDEDIGYIGGGRFGVITFDSPDKRYFKIRKIIEYEARDLRALWRGNIADHFSTT